jgi:hypothetical protein
MDVTLFFRISSLPYGVLHKPVRARAVGVKPKATFSDSVHVIIYCATYVITPFYSCFLFTVDIIYWYVFLIPFSEFFRLL